MRWDKCQAGGKGENTPFTRKCRKKECKRPRDQLSGHHKMRIELKYRLKMVKKESSLKDGHIKNLLKSTTKQIPKKVLKSWEMGTVIPPPPTWPALPPLYFNVREPISE